MRVKVEWTSGWDGPAARRIAPAQLLDEQIDEPALLLRAGKRRTTVADLRSVVPELGVVRAFDLDPAHVVRQQPRVRARLLDRRDTVACAQDFGDVHACS
jgi:hypothetical protein